MFISLCICITIYTSFIFLQLLFIHCLHISHASHWRLSIIVSSPLSFAMCCVSSNSMNTRFRKYPAMSGLINDTRAPALASKM